MANVYLDKRVQIDDFKLLEISHSILRMYPKASPARNQS